MNSKTLLMAFVPLCFCTQLEAGWNLGKALSGAAEAVGNAAGSVAKAAAQPVVAAAKTVGETAKVVTGQETPGQAAKNIGNELVKIPTSAGKAVNSTTVAAQDLANLPLDATKAGLSAVAGKPGEIAGDVLTVGQRVVNDGAAVGVGAVGNTLQGQNPLQANPATIALAAAIEAAREQHKDEAKPLPELVKAKLSAFYPPNILSKARFAVSPSRVSLPDVINFCQTEIGGAKAHAVTIDYIIVFSQEPGFSISDYGFWAHELQHVVQYDRMGVQGFAHKYILDHSGLEHDAEAKATEVIRSLASMPGGSR